MNSAAPGAGMAALLVPALHAPHARRGRSARCCERFIFNSRAVVLYIVVCELALRAEGLI